MSHTTSCTSSSVSTQYVTNAHRFSSIVAPPPKKGGRERPPLRGVTTGAARTTSRCARPQLTSTLRRSSLRDLWPSRGRACTIVVRAPQTHDSSRTRTSIVPKAPSQEGRRLQPSPRSWLLTDRLRQPALIRSFGSTRSGRAPLQPAHTQTSIVRLESREPSSVVQRLIYQVVQRPSPRPQRSLERAQRGSRLLIRVCILCGNCFT